MACVRFSEAQMHAYPLPIPAETTGPLVAPPLPGMCSAHLFTWSAVSISWDPRGWHKAGPFCGFLTGCFGWILQSCCGDLRLSYQFGVCFFFSASFIKHILRICSVWDVSQATSHSLIMCIFYPEWVDSLTIPLNVLATYRSLPLLVNFT